MAARASMVGRLKGLGFIAHSRNCYTPRRLEQDRNRQNGQDQGNSLNATVVFQFNAERGPLHSRPCLTAPLPRTRACPYLTGAPELDVVLSHHYGDEILPILRSDREQSRRAGGGVASEIATICERRTQGRGYTVYFLRPIVSGQVPELSSGGEWFQVAAGQEALPILQGGPQSPRCTAR
eukprot:1070839-Rhodomonas_salina.1